MKNFFIFIIGAVIGAAIVYFISVKSVLEVVIETPKGVITADEAKALDEAFNSRHQLISDSIVRRPDNRSSWYSLKDMRDYLNYAESETKSKGYTMNGIRVYMGAYPDSGGQVGYSTLFFVPTGSKILSTGNMISFNFATRASQPDIPGGPGLNAGDPGHPPSANYPQ